MSLFKKLLFGILLTTCLAHAGRPFLSMKQKGELLWTGGITDSAFNHYNVRILPGYGTALGFGGSSWGSGLDNEVAGLKLIGRGLVEVPKSLYWLHLYGTSRPWRGIGKGVSQGWHGISYLVSDFMIEGSARAWSDYFDAAARAQERESFGWPLAYPWALIKSTVNTALRQVFGLAGIAGCTVYGLVLRPTWELSYPLLRVGWDAVKGTARVAWGTLRGSWGLIGNQILLGTATPIAGWAWNTALGLPMALLAKVPTPRSADGWWVAMDSQSPDFQEHASSLTDKEAHRAGIARTDLPVLLSSAEIRRYQRRTVQVTRYQQLADSLAQGNAHRVNALEARIDSLQDSIRALRRHEQEQRDSLHTFIVLEPPPEAGYGCRIPYGEQGELWKRYNASRDSADLALLRQDPDNASFSDSVLLVAAHEFRNRWGRCLPDRDSVRARPQARVQDPEAQRKWNPNNIIQDETEQIFH